MRSHLLYDWRYKLGVQDTPVHWGGNWGTKNAVWVLLGEAKNRKRRGQKKENQLAAISIDGDHPRGTQAALA